MYKRWMLIDLLLWIHFEKVKTIIGMIYVIVVLLIAVIVLKLMLIML